MKKFRILIINLHGLLKGSGLEIGRDADNGGQTRYVFELAEYLSRDRHIAHVHLMTRLIDDPQLSDEYSLPIEIVNDKLDIRRIAFAGKKYRLKEDLWDHLDQFVANAHKHLKKYNILPDFIHSHYADAGYASCELASLLKVPFAHTGHSLGIAKKEKLEAMGLSKDEGEKKFKFSKRIAAEDETLKRARFIVTSTSQELETYEKYSNYSAATFKILAPGTDTEKFIPYYQTYPDQDVPEEELQRKYWVADYIEKFLANPNKPGILSLSRPDRRKNLHTLIEAYGKDKELQSLANLIIFAGIRKDIEKMPESEREVLIEILLLMDKYNLYGKLAIPKKHDVENEVATIYRYCAEKRGVFVNLTLHENFGLTLIEAGSTGLPVVATKNGGPSEIIPKCKNGVLVDPLNYSQINQAIKRILTDEEKWKDYSNQGIINVQKHYSWGNHVKTYVKWVREAVESHEKTVEDSRVKLKGIAKLFASDIDGTLISEEHDHAGLEELITLINSRPADLAIALASGRSIDLVLKVIEEFQLPLPDFLVCAVGSQIYYRHNDDFRLDRGWSSYLDKDWNRQEILRRLRSLDWLDLQEDEAQNPHKVSYYIKDETFKSEQFDAVLGKYRSMISVIYSHNLFLDILPRRASKGKALKYICRKWSIPSHDLYTAGDSGNDLDMLVGSGKGIIVSNHAPELRDIPTRKNLFRSTKPAAAGILEGLRHYGIF